MLLLSFTASFAQHPVSIIPQPQEITLQEGKLSFEKVRLQFSNTSLKKYLAKEFKKYDLAQISKKKGVAIVLENDDLQKNPESYRLSISNRGVEIAAGGQAGLFYGIQSLLQIMRENNDSKTLPFCEIVDEPRYGWRRFMVDESRHFVGKQKVKQILDYMAFHKMNVFHWHLTDAQGWRIEIKKYPKLTTIGAKGNETNANAPAQFYSQKDIQEIVKYATERQIQVIPEIDMPGHASAAILAYPENGGGGSEKHPNFTFNPGKEETYTFLQDILTEVAALFPSKYIHIGGDEVSFGNEKWPQLPEVQQLMKKENLKSMLDVEHYFIRRIQKHVKSLGKTMLGWDELAESGVPVNEVALMWWRHDKPEILDQILANKYPIILCPRVPLYLDFKQYESHKNGRTWGGKYATLEGIYEFPESLHRNVDSQQILGVQGNLWTERFSSSNSIDFMIFPRLAAISESGWTKPENKDQASFNKRLATILKLYDQDKLYYFNPFDISQHPEPAGVGATEWQKNHVK